MILTALANLARTEGLVENPDFQPVEVRWLVDVGPGGVMVGLPIDTQRKLESGKGKARSVMLDVPKRSKRTSGVSAEFIVDKPSYVFGWVHPDALAQAAKEGKPKSKVQESVAKQHDAYIAALQLAAESGADEGLGAWLALLESGGPPCEQFPGWTEGDLVSPRYHPDKGGSLAHRPKLKDYWSGRRGTPVGGSPDEKAVLPTCLVFGVPAMPVRLHPSIKGVPPISDTKGGVPFTSINADAFDSYGLRELGGVSVSQAAADAYQAALNRLLSPGYPHPTRQGEFLPVQNARLTDDTAVVFWAKDADEPEVADALLGFALATTQGEPDQVKRLFVSVHKGERITIDEEPFYALTLSGAIGRGTIRAWHETTLGAAVRNLKDYFDDLDLGESRPLPILQLLRQTAAQGKLENIPSALAGEVFLAVLTGRPFPRTALDALIRRVRAERTLYADRAAFLKAWLCRARRRQLAEKQTNPIPEVKPMLDKSCTDTAYLLGRLFALLEKLQDDAINAKASIRDRYYGAASATPGVVFPQLLRKVPHHVAKLEGNGKFLDIEIQKVIWDLKPPTPFPPTLKLEDQGLFAIGYYQQRQDLFTKRVKPDAATDAQPEAPALITEN